MPKLSVIAVRAALVYLFVGFTLGALMLANKGVPFNEGMWSFLAPHVELLVVGWTTQFILGVAFWIMPRYPGGSRGDERTAWIAMLLLNAGIFLAVLSAFGLHEGLLIGRLLEGGAIFLFTWYAWDRVRPLGKK